MQTSDIGTPGSRATSELPVRVMLRPIATPLSLGFLGLCGATFAVAGLELSWVAPTQQHMVGLVALLFAAPLQLVSAIFGFLARDPVAAAGMGVLAGTWATIGVVLYVGVPGVPSGGLGLLLVASAVGLLIPASIAALSKGAAAAVMGTAAVRFALTAGYELGGGDGWKTAAGVAGLVLASVALYAALAFELEGARRRTVLPTLRHGEGATALTDSFAQEEAGLEHEPGVRRTL